MLNMSFRDITAPYSAFETWTYDRFVAPAVHDCVRGFHARELSGIAGAARVLDVGCGGGQRLAFLAEALPDAELCGLDLSPRQVARAARRTRTHGDRVTVVEGSALDLPFDDGHFDLVVSFGSIKHWPDMRRGVSECARVLAPNGTMLVGECDLGCRLDDARAFIDRWRMPGLLHTVALAVFRTWVAGQGIDLDDGRALLADLPLVDARAERIPDTPFMVLRGRRA